MGNSVELSAGEILYCAASLTFAPLECASFSAGSCGGVSWRMSLSVFDIFKIGIGPSSSHTMGPMNAARGFAELLASRGVLANTAQVSAQLYGSLALTGRGHCTDRTILLGLEGMSPETIDSAAVERALQRIPRTKRLRLLGRHEIDFDEPLN